MRKTLFPLLPLWLAAACATEVGAPDPVQGGAQNAGKALGDAACASARGEALLVALEDGDAVLLDPRTGALLHGYETGTNAFGAAFSRDGRRAFVTDKSAGTLSEVSRETGATLASIYVGAVPQQPAVTGDGRMYIPLAGESAVAVVDIDGALSLLRKIPTGEGTKPHIVALSPDDDALWVTVQGRDPKVLSIALTPEGEETAVEHRYDLVPRVVAAARGEAWFTAHHSTGIHSISLSDGKAKTPFVDAYGAGSEPKNQIEGVDVTDDGELVALTHEGRKVAIVLDAGGASAEKVFETPTLSNKPYWVTLDPSRTVVYVSIPGSGAVQAYDLTGCTDGPLWTAEVGGKPKRMAVSTAALDGRGDEPVDEEHVLYFGRLEVQGAALKSALGRAPRAGEEVTLRVFLDEVASFVEGPYALATAAHLFVRFDGQSSFTEIQGLPTAWYNARGPDAVWSESAADVELTIPAQADRVEIFMSFDRVSYHGGSCYLAYDMMECPDSFPIDSAYVSNFGENFAIAVGE